MRWQSQQCATAWPMYLAWQQFTLLSSDSVASTQTDLVEHSIHPSSLLLGRCVLRQEHILNSLPAVTLGDTSLLKLRPSGVLQHR